MISVNEPSTHAVMKAIIVEAKSPTSSALSTEEQGLFTGLEVLDPPQDPAALCHTFEHSNSLRQTVDAYATNIDGFGHRLECTINFDAENADAEVAKSFRLEAMARGESCPKPSRRDIARRRRELEDLAEAERARLDAFFDTCCLDHSFVELRRRTRQDLEVTGNAYWEVVRNADGQIARLVHVPAHTMRLLPLAESPVDVPQKTRISSAAYQEASALRRPRCYVQKQGFKAVYFKSLGDPRVIGRLTGMAYADVETQHRQRPEDRPASEMVHFAIHSPHSPYGVPRWIGSLLSVLGSRQMEEVNYQYFANKSVPPLALLVSGGKLSESSISEAADLYRGQHQGHQKLPQDAHHRGRRRERHGRHQNQGRAQAPDQRPAARCAVSKVRRAQHGQSRGGFSTASTIAWRVERLQSVRGRTPNCAFARIKFSSLSGPNSTISSTIACCPIWASECGVFGRCRR